MEKNPGRIVGQQKFQEILTATLSKSVTADTGTSGFRSYGIQPLNPDVIPDHVFETSVASGVKQDGAPGPPPVMKSSEVPTTSQHTLRPSWTTFNNTEPSVQYTSYSSTP